MNRHSTDNWHSTAHSTDLNPEISSTKKFSNNDGIECDTIGESTQDGKQWKNRFTCLGTENRFTCLGTGWIQRTDTFMYLVIYIIKVILLVPVMVVLVLSGILSPGILCDIQSRSRPDGFDELCVYYTGGLGVVALIVGLYVIVRVLLICRIDGKLYLGQFTSDFEVMKCQRKCQAITFQYLVMLSNFFLIVHSLAFIHVIQEYSTWVSKKKMECEGDAVCEDILGLYHRAGVRHEEITVTLTSIIWTIVSPSFMRFNLHFPCSRVLVYVQLNCIMMLVATILRSCFGGRFLLVNSLFIFLVYYFGCTGCRNHSRLQIENFNLRANLLKENSHLLHEVSKHEVERTMSEEASDLVFQNSLAPIFSLDELGYVTMWNQGLSRLTSMTETCVVGKHISEMPFDSGSQCVLSLTVESGANASPKERTVSRNVKLTLIHELRETVVPITFTCFFREDPFGRYLGILCTGVVEDCSNSSHPYDNVDPEVTEDNLRKGELESSESYEIEIGDVDHCTCDENKCIISAKSSSQASGTEDMFARSDEEIGVRTCNQKVSLVPHECSDSQNILALTKATIRTFDETTSSGDVSRHFTSEQLRRLSGTSSQYAVVGEIQGQNSVSGSST